MFVGVGASVTGDTPILIRTNGETQLIPVGEFVDRYYEEEEEGFMVSVSDVETLGFEERDSKFKGSPKLFVKGSAWKQVQGVYRHRITEICEIHYLGGIVRTTVDHSLFIRTRNGIKPVAACDLKSGDVLVNLPLKVRGEYLAEHGTPHTVRAHEFAPLVEPLFLDIYEHQEETEAEYAFAMAQQGMMSQAAIAAVVGVSQATVGHWQTGKHQPRALSPNYTDTVLPERISVTPDLMKLFGYYTAEGRENGCLEFTFGRHETDLHSDCVAIGERLFGIQPKVKHTVDNSTKIIFYSAPLGRFFAKHCGTGSHSKHVPGWLWDLPREYFEAYLEGYARGDGYTTPEGKLSMTSVSHPLILELTWLAAMHGIKVGVRHMQLPDQGKKPIVREVLVKPFDGYVYDLCGCENEAFFGGEKPVLLHNSRVRDLFIQGKKNAPCIIFIDEIDAVGRHRGAGLGGGHDEREQTLNQLLVEMDGFESKAGVILIAATNRPDVLDPALLRPGRFDRQVVVPRPDVRGREEILKVHSGKTTLSPEVSLAIIAKGTPGFTGADLENLVNEAALLAARGNKDAIGMSDFEKAKDKVLMGAERKSMIISEKEKRTTAVHEAGHTLVAKMIPGTDPVHKVSIIPRGMALGVTQQLPEEDRYTMTEEAARNSIAVLMGGRAAEEVVFSTRTTGAGNDIEKATELARKMVCEWGMSPAIGPLAFGKKEEAIFLGKELSTHKDYSESTAQQIDHEIRRIVHEEYERAKKTIQDFRKALDKLAEVLLEREVIEGSEIDQILRQAGVVQSL
ncbi:MAG: ATP-dependent zinc metalloprotease FtsH [Deltaproteobacteria bacterium]|nr:ATP-dependent zinc metalloprotease FtsH [Deltaproteobacteria bacterium]